MDDRSNRVLPNADSAEIARKIRMHTPARLLVGRAGAAYRTETQLQLREDHAKARDAVRAELDLKTAFDSECVETWNLFEVSTRAATKLEFLARPALGRKFSEDSADELFIRCLPGRNIQIVIGDGLSALAVHYRLRSLGAILPMKFHARGWSIGQTFIVRH